MVHAFVVMFTEPATSTPGLGLGGFGGVSPSQPTTFPSNPLSTPSLMPPQSSLFTGGGLGTSTLNLGTTTPSFTGTTMGSPGLVGGTPTYGTVISQVQDLERRQLELRAASSIARRVSGRGAEGGPDMTSPVALYKQTPKSAAKIVPRGMLQRREMGLGGSLAEEQQHSRIISPGSDAYLGRGVKDLEVDGEGIFASESKILDRDEEGGGGGYLTHPDEEPAEESKDGGGLLLNQRSTLPSSGSLSLPPAGPNPHAPKLTKPGYYTVPPIEELQKLSDDELSQLDEFTVVRQNVGQIQWQGPVDVLNQNLDHVVTIEPKMVKVYGDKSAGMAYPVQGTKLNRPAIISFFDLFSSKKSIKEFTEYLQRKTEKWEGADFIGYDGESGTWIFSVKHFSGYGLDSEDEEEAGLTSSTVVSRSGERQIPQQT